MFGSLVEENLGADINARFQDLADLFIGYAEVDFDGKKIVERPVDNLYDLLIFLQSRRLHIMTILNLIPIYAQGDTSFYREEIPSKMNGWIGILMGITTGCQAILEAQCLPDFCAKMTPKGWKFSHQYTHLDKYFLEPQPLTPVELEQYRNERHRLRLT